jgi:hypothetical protein
MSSRRPTASAPEDSDRIEQLQEEIKGLKESLRSLTAANASRSEDPKGRKPKPFDGKSLSQLPEFLSQVRVAFRSRPLAYPDEEAKVLYAISYLEGPALSCIQPYIDKDEPPSWMTDFSLFTKQLKKLFGDPDVVGNTSHQLRMLKQTSLASLYAAEFRRLASQLDWGNQALVGQFFEGLSDSVQDELVKTDYATDLDALIDQAIRVDNLQQRRKAQRASSKPVLSTASPGKSLTEQQKEFRRKNNLCMYCGGADHLILNCPKRPKGPPRPARTSEAAWLEADPPGNAPTQSL